jgi:hypothetical protein
MGAIRDLGIRGQAVTGKSDAPVVQINNQYPLQSYFDNTLLEKALLYQAQGEPIVKSTQRTESIAGYAVGLHPSSQCPVAIRFQKGSQSTDSGVVVLKPGQIVRPNGEQAQQDGRFSGFDYGLPFGWLGGGSVTLIVFRTSDSKVDWLDHSEVIFHRQRAIILATAAVPASTALKPNWPISFPWISAKQGTNALPQGGQPILAVKPTRVAMALSADLAAAATMRMYFVGSTEFNQAANGQELLTDVPVAYDVVWGTWASLASANYAAQKQFQFLPVEAWRLSSFKGSMIPVAVDASLVGLYVDIIRYGEL